MKDLDDDRKRFCLVLATLRLNRDMHPSSYLAGYAVEVHTLYGVCIKRLYS